MHVDVRDSMLLQSYSYVYKGVYSMHWCTEECMHGVVCNSLLEVHALKLNTNPRRLVLR